jgi:1-acyl-sn-glycerol-3-phosphate acyltransferase
MISKFYGPFFSILQKCVGKIYPKYTTQIPDHIDGPVVFVSHHQNLFGPFVILLWFPKSLHAWMLHVFLDRQACFKQYVDYTFTKRFGWNKILAKLCAYPISYFITALLNSGKGIPVYRGSRKILETFHLSIDALNRGESIVLFPDIQYSDPSAATTQMYDGFLYLEKYYYKATGKHVLFVPLYASKRKHVIIADRQITFRDGEDFNTERKKVLGDIHDHLNELAKKCGDIHF